MPTLNDASRYTRGAAFGQLVPAGVLVGAIPVVLAGEVSTAAFVVVLVLALLGSIAANLVTVSIVRRGDRAFRLELDAGTQELLSGAVPVQPSVPARVVRRRPEVVVLTVLPVAADARRVAVRVPRGSSGDLARGSSHLVHLHPYRSEVAVLDTTADDHHRHLAGQDPRWTAFRLPTEGSVAGGWAVATGWGLAGLLSGVVVGAVVALVVPGT